MVILIKSVLSDTNNTAPVFFSSHFLDLSFFILSSFQCCHVLVVFAFLLCAFYLFCISFFAFIKLLEVEKCKTRAGSH